MPIPHGHNNMKVQILTEDPKKGDLLVCEGNVDLSKVLKEGEHDGRIPFIFPVIHAMGYLMLNRRLDPSDTPWERGR